ncbi:MAG: BamA/TamA family outer membrane protein [Verrucomicrobiota bacterium]
MANLQRLTRAALLLAVCFAPSWAWAGALFGLIGNPNVQVSGFGWFSDLYLERELEILEPDGEPRTSFDGVYLEDAVWILAGKIKQQGYLDPEITVTLLVGQDAVFESVWKNGDLESNPQRSVEGDRVQFRINAGRLYFFHSIEVEGLPEEIRQQPQSYFYATNQLIITEGDRFFTEGRFAGGINRMLQQLRDLGYREAEVADKGFDIDDDSGAVDAWVTIDPGPIYYTNSLIIRIHEAESDGDHTIDPLAQTSSGYIDRYDPELAKEKSSVVNESVNDFPEKRVQPGWVGQATQLLRREYFAKGYPEVFIDADFRVDEESDTRIAGPLILNVYPGASATLRGVRFEGDDGVAQWLLNQQANLETGEPLNRTDVEEGRSRLSRLGVFRRIQIQYEEVAPGEWDVIYELTPKGTTEIDLIFGVGSFDIVRGGAELKRNNLWGVAHRARLRGVQSLRATYVDFEYFVPQIFGENIDAFARLNFLRREEISFLRQEWGGSAGFAHFFKDINVGASVAYTLDSVRARDREFVVPPGPLEARIGSLGFKLLQNELDNPVFPTDGYHWFLTGEFARPVFGGDVDYNSFDLGGAWHHPVGDLGLTFHLGFRHGVIFTSGEASEEIPVNRRFFLGGENTVRGYRRDQAAPLNEFGQQIGAVSFMLLQGELEQRLNDTFSVVAFVDSVGNAAEIQDYPFNEVLVSVGAGIRIRTIVGPLRLEYGYNVKKRESDPDGNFQVGLGFPF